MKRLVFGAVLMSTVGMLAQAPAAPKGRLSLPVTTAAFTDGGVIPNKYTQAAAPAEAVSPELHWANTPAGTQSFTLIINDPDTALGSSTREVLHWLIFNIPGTSTGLPENVPHEAKLPDGSIQGMNNGRKVGYMGMGASGAGPYHHYTFELFALDTKLDLGPDATREDVMKAMDGHVLAKGAVEGRFHRPQ